MPKKPHFKLTPAQLQAIDMLSTGTRQLVVCERLDINKATMQNWLKKPEFKSALMGRLDEVRDDALNQLKTLTAKAVQTLANLLDGDPEYVPANVKLNASIKILEMTQPKSVHLKAINMPYENQTDTPADPAIELFKRLSGGELAPNTVQGNRQIG